MFNFNYNYNFIPNFNWGEIFNFSQNLYTQNLWGFSNFMPTNFMPMNFSMPNFNISSIFNWNIPQNTPYNLNNYNNFNNTIWKNNLSNQDTFTPKISYKRSNTTGFNLVNKAKSYEGKVNSDREGNRLFSNGSVQPWCADFVSTIVKDTYGSRLPSSFIHFSSVSGIRDWGKKNNCYLEMPSSNKSNYIAQNVKPGDIMIEKEPDGKKSHTGIVTKVNSDGSFETIEGNCGNKVASRKYSANSPTLSGFVTLDKYIA